MTKTARKLTNNNKLKLKLKYSRQKFLSVSKGHVMSDFHRLGIESINVKM